MCLQSMHMKCIEPSVLKVSSRSKVAFRNFVKSAPVISPDAIANSRCVTLPFPETCPAMGTL